MNGNRAKRSLPPDWRWARLGEVCEFKYGEGLPEHRRLSGTVPVYGSNGIVGNHSASVTAGASLIIGRKGSIGEVHYAPAPCWPIDTTYYVDESAVRVACDLMWLYFVLRWLRLNVLNKATGVPGLNREDAYSRLVPLPPLDEQRHSAARLSEQMMAVEWMRRSAEAQVEAAMALPPAFLRQVFESEEAKQWPRRRLAEVCRIGADQVNPTLPQYRDLPHVSGERIEPGACRLLAVRSAAEDKMVSGKFLFAAGDVLYSKIRPYLRKVAVADFDGLCSADIYPLRPALNVIDPRWLAWMLLSDPFTKYANEESSRVRMPKLNRRQLFSWEAPIPGTTVQRRLMDELAARMERSEKLRREAEAQLEAVNALSGALLEGVFGGFEPPS